MRRLCVRLRSLAACLVGLRRSAARAQRRRRTARRRSSRRAAARAAAPPADADDTESPRSLFDVDLTAALSRRPRRPASTATRRASSATRIVRDGLLFTDCAVHASSSPTAPGFQRARADNVGWRDQEYFADYEPHRPASTVTGPLGPDSAVLQRRHEDALYAAAAARCCSTTRRSAHPERPGEPATPTSPIAPQFDLRERRDIGRVDVVATPTPKLDVTAASRRRSTAASCRGAPASASATTSRCRCPTTRGPTTSRSARSGRTAQNMLRVAYNGSWFDNLDDTLVWDSPLRLDDVVGRARDAAACRSGRPTPRRRSASAATRSWRTRRRSPASSPTACGATTSRCSRSRSIRRCRRLRCRAANADAEAHVFSTNLNLTSHPATDWRFGARFRNYTYDNQMPATSITQYVTYDSSVSTTPTGGPDLYAHDRTTFDADATWSRLKPLALTVGYTHNGNGYDARIFKSSGEDVFRVSADAVGSSVGDLPRPIRGRQPHRIGPRREVAHRHRRAPGDAALRPRRPDEKPLHGPGRHRPVGRLDVQRLRRTPARRLRRHLLRTAGVERATPSRSPPTTTCRTAWARAPPTTSSAIPDCSSRTRAIRQTAQFNDPLRNWTSDSTETVHYFSIYATPPRIGRNTEVRFSYDFSHADGDNLYTIPAGSPITAAQSAAGGVQQAAAAAHRRAPPDDEEPRRRRSRISTSRSSIYDFAFDPSVVNGIVQPSSLVMGYVYRPYTANSFMFGLRYFW